MKPLWLCLIASMVAGCASAPTAFNPAQQLQLDQLVAKVSRQQITAESSTTHSMFVADFTQQTSSLLAHQQLMPALMQSQATRLVVLVEVAAGPQQYQLLSHGIKLSKQLEEFLVAQQFSVQRRIEPFGQTSQIRIESATQRGF